MTRELTSRKEYELAEKLCVLRHPTFYHGVPVPEADGCDQCRAEVVRLVGGAIDGAHYVATCICNPTTGSACCPVHGPPRPTTLTTSHAITAHPEARCEDCGGANVSWHTDSALWNRVCRPAGEQAADPMLCPRCFAVRAAAAGVDAHWTLQTEADGSPEPGGTDRAIIGRLNDEIAARDRELAALRCVVQTNYTASTAAPKGTRDAGKAAARYAKLYHDAKEDTRLLDFFETHKTKMGPAIRAACIDEFAPTIRATIAHCMAELEDVADIDEFEALPSNAPSGSPHERPEQSPEVQAGLDALEATGAHINTRGCEPMSAEGVEALGEIVKAARGTCFRCGGRGWTRRFPDQPCVECGGTGRSVDAPSGEENPQ
ncbi:MAG: hypothetical protein Q8K55_11380 [Gemmatimonadaceae bacterium]|nr:hypothetical protein [Gemmatimonadaceae bacterium]